MLPPRRMYPTPTQDAMLNHFKTAEAFDDYVCNNYRRWEYGYAYLQKQIQELTGRKVSINWIRSQIARIQQERGVSL